MKHLLHAESILRLFVAKDGLWVALRKERAKIASQKRTGGIYGSFADFKQTKN